MGDAVSPWTTRFLLWITNQLMGSPTRTGAQFLSWESPFPVAGWALAPKPEDLEPGQGQLFDFWLATPSRSPCSYDPLGRSDPLTYQGHVLLVLSRWFFRIPAISLHGLPYRNLSNPILHGPNFLTFQASYQMFASPTLLSQTFLNHYLI